MTDQELLKLLKDKKVVDSYQYYESSRYKLASARISYEALEKIVNEFFQTGKESIQKVFSDAIETGKGEYKPRCDTVNFCGIEIGVSTAINKLTMEILSLLHNFFDTYAQWVNASLLGENAVEISRASLRSVEKEIIKYPEYSSQFITDFCDIINQPDYLYISDFNNTLKHRTQIYVQNSINLFTSEGSVAIPTFEKDGRPHVKVEALTAIEDGLKFCEKQLSDSRQFIESYYNLMECLYTSHRVYNPKTYLMFESRSDYENSRNPKNHYYYIEVDPANVMDEYHIMLSYDHMSKDDPDERRIDVYNSTYPIVMLREIGSNNIIGILKPVDGETYKPGDAHSLCYRKYATQTADYQHEMFSAICSGEFHYLPFLSDATIMYISNDKNETIDDMEVKESETSD